MGADTKGVGGEKVIKFCPGIKCPHYSKATKHLRKCYYEVQCWRGYLDVVFAVVRFRFRRDDENNKPIGGAGRNKECETGARVGNSSHVR